MGQCGGPEVFANLSWPHGEVSGAEPRAPARGVGQPGSAYAKAFVRQIAPATEWASISAGNKMSATVVSISMSRASQPMTSCVGASTMTPSR